MAVEIEAKMKVADFEAVRTRLGALGAKLAGHVMETNSFFDTEDRSLLARDQGLRLRHAKDAEAGTEKSTITFKGPRLHGTMKNREERELSVGSPKDATALLESLGFARVLTFQKRRETWTYQDCEIELDELPYLGLYIEIEGPSEAAVLVVREKLNLSDRPMIRASYVALLITHLQERGINDRVVMFNAGNTTK